MTDGVEFISEPIEPDAETFDSAAMAAGRPGRPAGFTWRGRHYEIAEVLSEWKASEAEHHRRGERYYRKHYWRVRTGDDVIMTLYAVRKVKPGENPKRRWWLYSLEASPPKP